MWDPKYTENSWIGQYGKSHLPLIPKILSSINKYYPGTKLAFTEITYGGNNNISDGIAMADVLGIMAKYGIYYVSLWPTTSATVFQSAAYKIYRNYDGNESTFGDYYINSVTSDSVNTSVYGSIKNSVNEIHIIAINKYLTKADTANFSISYDGVNINSGKVYAFDTNSATPKQIESVSGIQNNMFTYVLPAGSVCHFVLETSQTTSSISGNNRPLNHDYKLDVFPNPFNPSCQINYSIPSHNATKLQIISITGEIVKSIFLENNSGNFIWNGTNNNNERIASGVYCVILRDGMNLYAAKKIMMLK